MRNCPCINCITFPICKAQVNEYMKTRTTFNKLDREYGFNVCISFLSPKCSLIKDWVNNNYEQIGIECFTILYRIYK